jgi:hypothetical protein
LCSHEVEPGMATGCTTRTFSDKLCDANRWYHLHYRI